MPTNRKTASSSNLLEDTEPFFGPAPLQWDGHWPATHHEAAVAKSMSLDVQGALSFSRPQPTGSSKQGTAGGEPEEDPQLEIFKNIASVRWDDNREVVRSYVDDLMQLQDKNQARYLLDRALKNGAPFTQRLACEALARLGKAGLQVLIKNVVHKDQTIHSDVVQALSLAGKTALPEILATLQENPKTPYSLQRQILIKFISRFPDVEVSQFLCKLLVVEQGNQRTWVLEGLLKQGRMAEIPLLEILENQADRPRLLKDCVYLLGSMRSKKAAKTLLKILAEEGHSSALICLTTWAIGEIGAPEAGAYLHFLLDDPTQPWMVKKTLIQTLGRLRYEPSVDLLIALVHQRELRENAIEALGRIGSAQALVALEPFLSSPVNYLRGLTITALSRISDRKALRLMLNGLMDPDPFVRNLTHKALEELYSPAQIEEIYSRLESDCKRQERREAWRRFWGTEKTTDALDEPFDETIMDAPEFSPQMALNDEFYEPSIFGRLKKKLEDKVSERLNAIAPLLPPSRTF